MGLFLLQMSDESEMILTAGRATRTDTGDIGFERVDACGNWSRFCTVAGGQIKAAYARKTDGDGAERWEPQPSTGRWWAY
ncbi:hypothetical protein J7I94_31680 [Streptomyces sp. ISL-12]|uniref:hypothetical protein n=1 Tax=Streptomyces sp. ISL-12 TaxID=2819177 RepID=UPI001BE5553C|nr:hypothetical protein [Streptomyces sp. ISL-12]MBT2415049.1 hypothetical protein [Streptomyces sp. ISL-12]